MTPPDEIDDAIAQLHQSADQMGALIRDIGMMLGGFRRELVAQGFNEDQITQLCLAQLNLIWTNIIIANLADELSGGNEHGND